MSTEQLFESATEARRDRDAHGRLLPSPAWADLTAVKREQLFDYQLRSRFIERALDADGLSTTARSVLERTRVLGQL